MASKQETTKTTNDDDGGTAAASAADTTPSVPTSQDGNSSSSVASSLERLSLSLQQLDDKTPHALSHYRQLTPTCTEAYDILHQGAALCHGTSTKFTLMEKIANSEIQTREMSQTLLRGCELIGTACLVLHEPSTGCSTACRQHVKQASRAIVQTVLQLVQTFEGPHRDVTAFEEGNTLGAQRTGAVWQTCNVVLEKKLPRGNRNAMRRQLFSFLAECRETLEEFQEIIHLGPALVEEEEEEELDDDDKQQQSSAAQAGTTSEDDNDDDDGWFAFLSGKDQQYTMNELPVATAALALIKMSRGAINLTVQACEAVGEGLHENVDDKDYDEKQRNKDLLAWMEELHLMACRVGNGMTDLGATLYPPLQLLSSGGQCCELQTQIQRQADAMITPLLDHVLDHANGTSSSNSAAIIDLPESVVELATRLQENLPIRKREALEAIATATATATGD